MLFLKEKKNEEFSFVKISAGDKIIMKNYPEYKKLKCHTLINCFQSECCGVNGQYASGGTKNDFQEVPANWWANRYGRSFTPHYRIVLDRNDRQTSFK